MSLNLSNNYALVAKLLLSLQRIFLDSFLSTLFHLLCQTVFDFLRCLTFELIVLLISCYESEVNSDWYINFPTHIYYKNNEKLQWDTSATAHVVAICLLRDYKSVFLTMERTSSSDDLSKKVFIIFLLTFYPPKQFFPGQSIANSKIKFSYRKPCTRI